jgi:hypothetical protein
MTDERQEHLETSCIKPENFIREVKSVRRYYMNTGRIIGAGSGMETCFIYVEHSKDGSVHGYPITEAELKQMGVKL